MAEQGAGQAGPVPRLHALDFVRGVAVLGILLLNIVGFAWPEIVYLSPRAPTGPQGEDDDLVYLVLFVFADGKFRGLFALLFGAGMLLLMERTDAAGRDGEALQRRRLAWLALFGLAHFFLLWWGDILFLYAVCGFAVLPLSYLSPRVLAHLALAIYVGGVLALGLMSAAAAVPWLEHQPPTSHSAQEERRHAAHANAERAIVLGPWSDKVAYTAATQWSRPFETVVVNAVEVAPLMLLGMALLKVGFFAGQWPRARLRRWAGRGIAAGLVLTVPVAGWLWAQGFPPALVRLAQHSPAALGRLALVVGYAALLVLATDRLGPTWLGRRVIAAGRMAFSNYIGTTLLMTGLFHGWGLGLFGRFDRVELLGFVALGWAAMLAWSEPWLARFRHGPLEWLWRSLIARRPAPMRRVKPVANAIESH